MPVRAEVILGRREKVAVLKVTVPITVETKDGVRIKGQFEDLSDTDLMLVTNFSQAVIPKEDIETITTQPEDGLADGTLIGGGIGAGVMMSALAVKSDHDLNGTRHAGDGRHWLRYRGGGWVRRPMPPRRTRPSWSTQLPEILLTSVN